jgi:hypothetical protein
MALNVCGTFVIISRNLPYKVMEDEMGRACNIHRLEEECMKDFGGKATRKETSKKT